MIDRQGTAKAAFLKSEVHDLEPGMSWWRPRVEI